jgi:hypothetical protein
MVVTVKFLLSTNLTVVVIFKEGYENNVFNQNFGAGLGAERTSGLYF